MYYCKSRYYASEWCRWLNGDSVGYLNPQSINGMNLFAYCNNNPVMGMDPTGHFTILGLIIGASVGALFGLGGALIKDATDGGGIDGSIGFLGYFRSIIGGAVSGTIGGLGGESIMFDLFLNFVGGIAENAINGGFQENGVLNTLIGIGVGSILSFGAGKISNIIASIIKVGHLMGLSHSVANSILDNMGVGVNIGSKVAKKGLAKIIRQTDGILLNILSDSLGASIFGGLFSTGWEFVPVF